MAQNSACLCSTTSSSLIEACQSVIVIGFSVLAIVTNVLTVLVLGKVHRRSSTETLLLFLTISELGLPIIVLARYLYISFDDSIEDFPYFRVSLFYAWNVLYVTSSLLTLLLAARRYIAIEYALVYQSLSRQKYTTRMLLIIYVFSALLFLPVLFFKPDFVLNRDGNAPRLCSGDMPKEVIYTSIMVSTVYLKGSYTAKINYLLYISIYVFQLISPLILAVLSFKFMRSLSRRTTVSNQAKKRTKLILIVSLLILIRDLPLGLLSTYFVLFLPAPACLTIMRMLTQELMIIMCSMNFVVLYITNQKFKEAVPRLKWILFCSRDNVRDEPHGDNVLSSVLYKSTTTSNAGK